MRHSRHIAALLIVVMALVVAGCGGGDESSDATVDTSANGSGQTVANQTPTTGATTPTGAAGTPAASGTAPATAAGASGGGLEFPTDDSGTDIGVVSEILDPIDKNSDRVFGALVNTDPKSVTATTDTTKTDTTSSGGGAVDTTPKVTYSYGPATLSVNGTRMVVAEGGVFPSDTQYFTLREISPTSVTVDLTSGQFGNGAQGFFLRVGKSRTIENQNEGEEFVIKLISITKEANTTNG